MQMNFKHTMYIQYKHWSRLWYGQTSAHEEEHRDIDRMSKKK